MILVITFMLVRMVSSFIYIHEGKLEITGRANCTIENNGMVGTLEGPVKLNIAIYGYIEYDCGIHKGKLISPLKCRDCGLFCIENMEIGECEHVFLPVTLAVVLTTPLSIIIFIYISRLVTRYYIRAKEYLIYINEKRKLNKEINLINKMQLHTKIEIDPHFNPNESLSAKYQYKIREKIRTHKSAINLNTRPIITTQTLIIVFLITIPLVLSCDKEYYISSKNNICEDNKCEKTTMTLITLPVPSTVCFTTSKGTKYEIEAKDLTYNTIYKRIYYTSEYKTIIKKTSNCVGEDQCWKGSCLYNEAHSNLKKEEVHHNSSEKQTVSKYGCGVESLGCQKTCWLYGTSCTWYRVDIIPVGNLASVYRKVETIWELQIMVRSSGIETRHKLNSYTSKINLVTDSKTPIAVISVVSPTQDYSENLLEYNNVIIETNASPLNSPEPYKIGEIQISLDKNQIIYNTDTINCGVSGCNVDCKMPQQWLLRSNNMKEKVEMSQSSYEKGVDGEIIIAKKNVVATTTVIVGDTDIANMLVTKAKCNIEVIETFSCSACNVKQYIITQASMITERGSLTILSNCSLSQYTLPCSEGINKLEMDDMNKYCYIHIIQTNKTLNIVFNKIYNGILNPISPNYASNTEYNIARSIITDKNFINTIFTTFNTISVVGILSTIALKVLKIWQTSRLMREVERV